MAALEEFLALVSRDVDETLDELIPQAGTRPKRLHEAIRWSVFAGGKRIRPAILIAVGRTFGAANERLRRASAAVELIHTYSLVQDDLSAIDDLDLRRGDATSHNQFRDVLAVLARGVAGMPASKVIREDEGLNA